MLFDEALSLRGIKVIRRYLTVSATILLVRALVLSRIDYCNRVLLGLPANLLDRLQSVMNVSACLIFGARWNAHVMPLLCDKLHWLRMRERIVYKRCLLTYRALYDPDCPDYITCLLRRTTTLEQRRQLRSSSHVKLLVPPPSKMAKFRDRSMTWGNPAL